MALTGCATALLGSCSDLLTLHPICPTACPAVHQLPLTSTASHLYGTHAHTLPHEEGLTTLAHNCKMVVSSQLPHCQPTVRHTPPLQDEGLTKMDPSRLPSLRPYFKRDGGTVTAGNASPLTDGAAALVVASAEAVRVSTI